VEPQTGWNDTVSRVFDLLGYCFAGAGHILDTRVLKKPSPLVGGIALNDSCNLHCRHCSVANRNIPDMSFDEICFGLRILHGMKIRTLFIEGGEPFLWKSENRILEDVVRYSRSIGFRSIIVYTNGTFPIETSADSVFVSLDGLKDTNDRLRGRTFNRVIRNIEVSAHPKILINFTINSINEAEIEEFCREIVLVENIRGIFFYFYTPNNPYDGRDELFLDHERRALIIERLFVLKSNGFPVLNSRAALKGVQKNMWDRPTDLCYLYANNELYQCCRAVGNQEICADCGYLGYAELHYISRLKPGAILAAMKTL
jgi:sulfatase maturation enzyme AslB (radical SAM superfamily)